MRINNFDFEGIQSRLDAARNLQYAGEDQDCEKVLWKLAQDLIQSIEEQTNDR